MITEARGKLGSKISFLHLNRIKFKDNFALKAPKYQK